MKNPFQKELSFSLSSASSRALDAKTNTPQKKALSLKDIQQHLYHLQHLTILVQQALKSSTLDCSQWMVASYENNVLCLAVPNYTVASQIKYVQVYLMEQLKYTAEFTHIKTIKTIVEPLELRKQTVRPKEETIMTENTRAILNSTADYLQDSELSKVLRRIASQNSRK